MKISGEKLKAARESAGITRLDLSVSADLTHARIWQIETSETSEVNANVVAAMAAKLNTLVANLEA